MMRLNHEFGCFVTLSPGCKNWVEMTSGMQQEGVGLVFLPRRASLGVFRTHKSIYVTCVAVALPPMLMRPRLLEEPTGRSWLFSCSL